MKTLTEHRRPTTLALILAAWIAVPSCGRSEPAQTPVPDPEPPVQPIIQAPPDLPRPPFRFDPADEALLNEIQHGAFNFLFHGANPNTGMVPDRLTRPDIVSVAGVGFQLSALPIGIARGWISREQGEQRALLILNTLLSQPSNRKAGLFYHFVDADTGGTTLRAYEHVVSTIDSALLFAGVITAGQYFGGAVAERADRLIADANWAFFVAGEAATDAVHAPFISLGWRPTNPDDPTGDGTLLPYYWIDSGDEHRLVTFLAVAAPNPDHAVPPETYYRLRRQLGSHGDTGPFVWFPWSGALFVSFFAHCWIDYAAMGPDDPAARGVPSRARVDWWENARRTVRMHRLKAVENPKGLPTLGENAWGLTASDVRNADGTIGYGVPDLFPDPLPMPGAIPNVDFAVTATPVTDDWGDGTIAPYGAGSAIMFDPHASLAALRHYRALAASTLPDLWRDPAAGGFGFADAFNLGTNWVALDYVAIDQGPLILAIENARTGMIWDLFHAHPVVKEGLSRLGRERPARVGPPAAPVAMPLPASGGGSGR